MIDRDFIIERLEKKIVEKDKEIRELRKMVEIAESKSIAELESKIAELRKAVESVVSELTFLKSEVKELREKVELRKTDVQSLQSAGVAKKTSDLRQYKVEKKRDIQSKNFVSSNANTEILEDYPKKVTKSESPKISESDTEKNDKLEKKDDKNREEKYSEDEDLIVCD